MAVVEPGYLGNVELFESRLQIFYMFQVGCHLKIPHLLGFQKFVDNQLGVGADVEFLNPHVFGKVESGYECLVLCFIIRCLKDTVYILLDEIPFG